MQRQDGGGELVGVGLLEVLVVELVAAHLVLVDVAVEHLDDAQELGVDLLDELGVDLGQAVAHAGVGLLGALDVGAEVEQVDVGVGLLLAGDLGGGDLLEQVGRAVGEVLGQQVVGEGRDDLLHQDGAVVGELLGVGDGVVGDLAVLPQVALDGVEAVPAGGLVQARLTHVDEVVEVLGVVLDVGAAGHQEAVDGRLGALVVGAGVAVDLLGLLEVAALQGLEQLVGGFLHALHLGGHVIGVVLHALGEDLLDGALGSGGCLTGDGEGGVLLLGAGGVELVLAAAQGLGEGDGGKAGGHVLLLAQDALVVEQLELGDARRGDVGHVEGDGAGLDLGDVDDDLVVLEGDVDLGHAVGAGGSVGQGRAGGDGEAEGGATGEEAAAAGLEHVHVRTFFPGAFAPSAPGLAPGMDEKHVPMRYIAQGDI